MQKKLSLKKFKDTLKLIFPSNLVEWILFVIFLTSYGILGSYIALNYRIIFDDRIPWDAYFSFDNRSIIMTGGGFERHPLSNYFFDWIRKFALWISDDKKNEIFRLVLAWCSNFAVSLALVQLFKYLRNIVRIPLKINILLTVFFAFFTTPILLSFTPETYTYTLLFLVAFNYYAAAKLKKEKKISLFPLTFASVLVGGLTITNIVKVYIPILFEKNLFKSFKTFFNAAIRVIISAAVFVLLFLYRLDWDYMRIFTKTGEQYEKFSKPKVTPLWDMISSWFFGGNMIFSNFVVRDYHNKKGFHYNAIFMDVFSSVIPYLFVAAVLILVFWSYFKNFKNKFVQILMLSFFVDILIHCVLKFGLHTSYIYGGHFIFVVPMMLGWLFFVYKNSPKMLSFLTVFVGILFVFLVANNIYRMEEFCWFLDKNYR